MEQRRSRRNSTSSLHSQSNSSIANVQCADMHTHAIVQREKDGKVILVPLDGFINFGKTIKVNEIATYKEKKDSRKADRGKVLIFGTEDLCVDQLQVLQEEIVDENQLPNRKATVDKKNSSLSSSNNINNEKSIMNINEQLNDQVQKKNHQKYVMSESTTTKGQSQLNEIDNLFNALSPIKINTASSITIGPSTRNEKYLSQVKRKLFTSNADTISTNYSVLEDDGINEVEECLTTTKKSKKVTIGESSIKRTTDVNQQVMLKKLTSTGSSGQTQHQSVLKPSESNQNSAVDITEDNGENEPVSISYKKYKKVEQELANLRKEHLSLQNRMNFMKKNYVPMPDIKARPWFIRVAKMFGEKLSATDICTHAQYIGINNPNQLLGCIRDRGTDTARQIIRALFSKEKLETESGTTAVSDVQREAIRNFVELQNGAIPDHQFNEAINGVFRQAKTEIRKAQGSMIQTSIKNKKINNGQQTIDNMLCSKKSTVENNVTKKSTNTMSNFDDDDDSY